MQVFLLHLIVIVNIIIPIMATTQLTTVSAGDVRNNLGEIINRALYAGERFLVERRGEPVIKIVAVRKDEVKKDFFEMTDKMRGAFSDLDEDEINDLVNEAVREVRADKKAFS